MLQDNTLAIYESVALLTTEMVVAARKQDWERLAELEANCADYVEKLKDHDQAEPLTGKALARKLASIKKILADDREIRDLVDPWMVKFSNMMTINAAHGQLKSSKRHKHTLQ